MVFREWFGREWDEVAEFKWEMGIKILIHENGNGQWELNSGNGREWEY